MNQGSRRLEVVQLILWIISLAVYVTFRSVPLFRSWIGYLYLVVAILGLITSAWKLYRGRAPSS